MEALLFRYYTAKKALEDKRKELESLDLECEAAHKACVEGGIDLGVFGDPSNSLDGDPSNHGEPIVVHPSAPSLPRPDPPQEGYLRDGPNWQIDCSVGSVRKVVKRFILNGEDRILSIRENFEDSLSDGFQWIPPGKLAKLVAHRGDLIDSFYMRFHLGTKELELTHGVDVVGTYFNPIGQMPWAKYANITRWTPVRSRDVGNPCPILSGTTFLVGKGKEKFFIKVTKIE